MGLSRRGPDKLCVKLYISDHPSESSESERPNHVSRRLRTVQCRARKDTTQGPAPVEALGSVDEAALIRLCECDEVPLAVRRSLPPRVAP